MTSPLRFLVRPERLVPIIVVAGWLFEAGCVSSGAQAPDAAGVDAAPDNTATDIGGGSDGAPTDVADDRGTGDGSQSDGGGDAGDPCRPPCWAKLFNGCVPDGSCVVSGASYCYSNGVDLIASPPGNLIQQTITKNGVLCVKVDLDHNYIDPNGNVLGQLFVDLDNSVILLCTGEDPVTIPNTCVPVLCTSGTCP